MHHTGSVYKPKTCSHRSSTKGGGKAGEHVKIKSMSSKNLWDIRQYCCCCDQTMLIYSLSECLKTNHTLSRSLSFPLHHMCVCVRREGGGGPRAGLSIEKCVALSGTHDWAIQFDLVKVTTPEPCSEYQSHLCQRTQISRGQASACVR